jgi:hypothetical protein
MRMTSVLAVGAIGMSLMLTLAIAAAQQPSRQVTAAVTDLRPDGTLKLDFLGAAAGRALPVDAATKAQLQAIQPGDVVSVEFDQFDNPQRITRVVQVSRPVGVVRRLVAVGIALFAILLAAMAATGGDVRKLLIGQDNRYSNSKSQLVFWFGAVMVIYLATLMLRVSVWGWDSLGGVGLTTNLLALTGLSALTMGAAKAVTTTKLDSAMQDTSAKTAAARAAAADASGAAAAAAAAPDATSKAAHIATEEAAAQAAEAIAADVKAATAPKSGGVPNFLLDLFQNDKGQVDLGDFQMIFIAVLAVCIFLLTGFHFLGLIPREATTLPDVDTTLLSSFGIGQGAYIVKKMASKPGEG